MNALHGLFDVIHELKVKVKQAWNTNDGMVLPSEAPPPQPGLDTRHVVQDIAATNERRGEELGRSYDLIWKPMENHLP